MTVAGRHAIGRRLAAVLIAGADADVLGRMASTACWPSRLRVTTGRAVCLGAGDRGPGTHPSDFDR